MSNTPENITPENVTPEKKKMIAAKARALAVLFVLLAAMFISPAAAAINVTLITQAMTDIGSIIDSLSTVWTALVNMVIGIMPLMMVLAIIGFITGLFGTILAKIKGGV